MYESTNEDDYTFFDVKVELSPFQVFRRKYDPKPLPDFLKQRVIPSRSPEQVKARLEKACEVLARNPHILDERNNMGETPLIASILNGEKELVRLLLEHGADPNKLGRVKGELIDRSPLEIAINYNGNAVIVSTLLEHGADPYHRDNAGQTFLMLAALGCYSVDPPPDPEADPEANFRGILELIPDVNQRSSTGNTALHYVRFPAFIPMLCTRGADLNVHGSQGKTPLHRYVEEALVLVETFLPFGPEVNVRDEDGATPLHYVSFNYDSLKATDIVRLLLAVGADPNSQDNLERTPLHLAVDSLHREAVRQLVEAGAELNVRDKEGHTPLKMLEGDKSNYDWWPGPWEEEIEDFLRSAGAHL